MIERKDSEAGEREDPMNGTWLFQAPGSYALGDLTVGSDCSLWYNAVVRADEETIHLGDCVNIQDGCVLHVDRGYPIILGDNVTVGHGAILHGCTVGENTVVGMGSILLNGCEVGRNSMVAAGALVPPGKTYPEGSLLIGSPAKVARALTEEEILANRNNAEVYVRLVKEAAGQE